jgi:hypothetical protein
MDVGFYLGELLMQQGEVSVPGLGYFVQVRMSGYYDENERKFYPPYHQAQFDIQSIDDDALAEYIAVKKNISCSIGQIFCRKIYYQPKTAGAYKRSTDWQPGPFLYGACPANFQACRKDY